MSLRVWLLVQVLGPSVGAVVEELSGGRVVSVEIELLGMLVDSSATTVVWVVTVG